MKGRQKLEDRYGRDSLNSEEYEYNLEVYGEMIPSVFSWMTPEEQRKRVQEIQDMLEKKDGKARDVDLGFKNLGLK